MRVTNTSTYRNFTTSVNNVHANLIKSMNKVSSGEAYEAAAESPLSYYDGKKIDHKYQDTVNKLNLIKEIQNRIYQQELGARDIQDILKEGKRQVEFARTGTTTDYALATTRDDLYQKQFQIIDALNMEYEDFFIYGGNDVSNTPFALTYNMDEEGSPFEFTYTHKFPGEEDATTFKFRLEYTEKDGSGSSEFKFVGTLNAATGTYPAAPSAQDNELLIRAMSEQGRIDIGYGSLSEKDSTGTRDTLIDTYTGGLNLLTGLTSDAIRTLNATVDPANPAAPTTSDIVDKIMDSLSNSPLGLIGSAIQTIDSNLNAGELKTDIMFHALGELIPKMTESEHTISTVYSDLGNKYSLLEDTKTKLEIQKISLTTQYKDKMGADPYESVMEMYNSQYAYNAALKVGANLMGSSLFDFMG